MNKAFGDKESLKNIFLLKKKWKGIDLISFFDVLNILQETNIDDIHLKEDFRDVNCKSNFDYSNNFIRNKSLLQIQNFSNYSKIAKNLESYFKKYSNVNSKLYSTYYLNGFENDFENLNQNTVYIFFSGFGELYIDNDDKNVYDFGMGDIIHIPNNTNHKVISRSQSIYIKICFSNFEKNNSKFTKKEFSLAYQNLYHSGKISTLTNHFESVKKTTKQKKYNLEDLLYIVDGYISAGFESKANDFVNKYQLRELYPAVTSSDIHIGLYGSKSLDIEKAFEVDKNILNSGELLDCYLSFSILKKLFHISKYILEQNGMVGNWNYEDTDELFVDLNIGDVYQEIGIIFVHLPLFNYLIEKFNIKKLYLKCRPDFKPFFDNYFPNIKVVHDQVDLKSKVKWTSVYQAFIHLHSQPNSDKIVKEQIKKNRKKVLKDINSNSNKLGLLWFSNDIKKFKKGVPLGVYINTIGNNDKTLTLKSLQYNDPKTDIEIFNNNSKNKIEESFYNDFYTPVSDIVQAVFDCHAVIGTSNVILIAGAFGIPSLIVSGQTFHHWYINPNVTPAIKSSTMRFPGDWQTIYDDIYSFVDKHFD